MPALLRPFSIELNSPEFKEICGWPFTDSYAVRLLQDDIPQRAQFGNGRFWIYRDAANQIAGFGTIDVCDEYSGFYGEDTPHPYIPLLAKNPTIEAGGYGTSIVRHLIAEAAILARPPDGCHDVLFLDVYATNTRAIALYERSGFTSVSDGAIPDPHEGNTPYIIMAQRLSVAPS